MEIREKNMTEKDQSEELPEQVETTQEAAPDHEALLLELKDQLLRTAAESQNMRRRYEKQIEDAREYSTTSFAKDLVPVMDNLSKALEHLPAEMDEATRNFVIGVEMTKAELARVFAKHGIESIAPSLGDKFDYNFHSAMLQVPTDEHPENSVLQLMQVGYKIKERLLRPASVAVSKIPVPD